MNNPNITLNTTAGTMSVSSPFTVGADVGITRAAPPPGSPKKWKYKSRLIHKITQSIECSIEQLMDKSYSRGDCSKANVLALKIKYDFLPNIGCISN